MVKCNRRNAGLSRYDTRNHHDPFAVATCKGTTAVVSRSQTAFFRFSLWWRKKGSGNLTIEFACDEIDRFCRALITGDEPKEVLTTCAVA